MIIVLSAKQEDLSFYKKVIDHFEKNNYVTYPKSSRASEIITNHSGFLDHFCSPNILVPILTEHSVKDDSVNDLISAAYLADIKIVPITVGIKAKVARESMQPGTLLILCNIQWAVIKKMEQFNEIMDQLTDSLQSSNEVLNKRKSTMADMCNFWDKHFPNETDVKWFRFKDAFNDEFKVNFEKDFDELQRQWIYDSVMYEEIFHDKDPIKKIDFDNFMASSKLDSFYTHLYGYVTTKFAMKEVLSMESTVRLDMIRRMSKFNTHWVLDELLEMLRNEDPNIRGISCLALAKMEIIQQESFFKVSSALMNLLNNKELSQDRLVRECLVIAFGKLKLDDSVPILLHLWRNDAIKDVREGAEVALKNIGGDRVDAAIQITKKIDDEIRGLTVE